MALAVVGLMLGLAALVVFDTAHAVIRLRSPYPYIDEWDNLATYRGWMDGQIPTPQAFLWPNYEHRIAFPRLVLFLDYGIFGGRGTLDLVVIFATQCLQAAILITLAWSTQGSRLGRLAIAAIVVGLMLSLRQWQNFVWGFQVSFVGVFALASVGLWLFAQALGLSRAGGGGARMMMAAYAVAFVATFTLANGMLVAAVMTALALVGRAGWRIVGSTGGITLALAMAYKTGLDIQPGYTVADALGRLRQPARLIAFTAIDLGNLQAFSILAARWLGYGAMAVFALVAATAVRRRERSPARLTLFGIMLFCLGSAMMTALGRLDYGMEQALSSRYSSGTSLFWSAALVYAWCLAAEGSRPVRWRVALCVAGMFFLACVVRSGRLDRRDAEIWSSLQRRGADLTLSGLTQGSRDPNDGNLSVQPEIAFLRARGLSIFSRAEGSFVGRPLLEAGPLAPPASCRGGTSAAVAIPEQAQLHGVAVKGFGNHPQSGRVYVADPEGTMVGFASYAADPGQATIWEGFARAPVGERLSAYVLLPNGALCKLGEAPVAPARPSG